MDNLNFRERIIPICIFLIVFGISITAWYFEYRSIREKAQDRFEIEVSHLQQQIENRFKTYEQVLRGGIGLFRSSSSVSRVEWRSYVEGLNLSEYFPGIQGLGFSEWIGAASNVAAHEKKIQAEGFPNYRIKPAGLRENYTSIIYLEPFDRRNREAFGYDMFSEATRREAMQRAIDTGESTLTGKVELVQEITSDKQPGFLLYLPLYSTVNVPETVSKRRDAFLGFVYSPFRSYDLVKGILQENTAPINFKIYDGNQELKSAILYDGGTEHLENDKKEIEPKFKVVKKIEVGGRAWTIKFSSTQFFGSKEDTIFPWILLIAGILLSCLSAIFAWTLLLSKRNIQLSAMQLSKEQGLNNLLLDELSEGLIFCDSAFNITVFNGVAREWYGYELDFVDIHYEMWGEFFSLYEENGDEQLRADQIPLVRALNGEKIKNLPMRIQIKDSPVRYVLVSSSRHVDGNGKGNGAFMHMHDITDIRDASEDIKRQEAFLREVINCSPNYVYARNRDGIYVLANESYANNYFSLSPWEVIGKTDEDLINKIYDQKFIDQMNVDNAEDIRILNNGKGISGNKKIYDFKGGLHWFHTVKLPINAPDNSEKIVLSVASDITEERAAQEVTDKLNEKLESGVKERTEKLEKLNQDLILSKEEAEAANQAKSSFLAAMSHEIRTPMNGVVGMVEVLMTEPLTKSQKESISIIRDSAFSLLTIIDDLLDFSKIEAGHLELESLPISVGDIVEAVVSNLVPAALKNHVYIDLFIDPSTPDNVLGDVTRIRQIMTNLIGNALKFSGQENGQDGKVYIRVTTKQAEPPIVQFEVIDNGIGMAPDTVKKIFNSFVQAESSTTRRFGGTGLGLAICKRLTELMGGEVYVDSEEGVGSTFTITIPFTLAPATIDKSYEDVDGVNCIVIPSDHFHAEDFEVYLESAGAIVYEESNRHEAAKKALAFSGPVVVIQASEGVNSEDLDETFEVSQNIRNVLLSRGRGKRVVDVRHVMLSRGRRKRPRVESLNTVTIDADGLRREALIEAVSIAAGKASPEVMQSISGEVEQHQEAAIELLSIDAARAAGKLILVAEDDSINTKVIERQLALLGFTAEFAENGLIALDMWRNKEYGLLLTDLHMPEMDGYSLAQTIRQEEAEGTRFPIVALTANALRGEALRAKALGVDKFLTKPIELHLLKEALETYLNPLGSIQTSVKEKSKSKGLEVETLKQERKNPINDSKVFDESVLPRLLGDDLNSIKDLLSKYLDSLDEVSNLILEAGKEKDWQTVAQLAHRLKSSSLSLGALQLGELCKELEAASKKENQVDLVLCLSSLVTSREQANAEISAYLNKS